MPEAVPLSRKLGDYHQWANDAESGKFMGYPIREMSRTDLLSVIGVLNHLAHNSRDERIKREAGGLILPPGFVPKAKKG